MPDPLFQNLFDVTDTMTWAPTDVVRDRARRRVRRTRVAAVAAAVVTVGLVSGGVAVAQREPAVDRRPGTGTSWPAVESPPWSSRPPVPSTPGAPEGTALFLRPGDVGPGYREVVDSGEGSGDWTFEFSAQMLGCPVLESTRPRSIARQDRMLSRGTPQAEDLMSQYVARYRPGDTARYLDHVRARVGACEPGSGKSITIGAQGFAGQGALLIEVNYGEGFTTKHVLVRQGDLLTEFFTKPERTSAAAQELGRTAAQRLCGGTPVC